MGEAPKTRDTSRLANCYQAVLVIYLNALRASIRMILTERFGGNTARELQRAVGGVRWSELERRAGETAAIGRAVSNDPFEQLDFADLHRLADEYFFLLHPAAGGPDSAHIKRVVLRRMAFIKEERDAIAHPGKGDLDWDAAVAVINSVKHVLRAFRLKEPRQEAQQLLDELFEELVPARTEAAPNVDDFLALWGAANRHGGSYEAFLKPLMELFQGIADDFAEMDREPWVELQPGETLSDYALRWNTAPENVVFALQDWLIHGNAGGERMQRLRHQMDELRRKQQDE